MSASKQNVLPTGHEEWYRNAEWSPAIQNAFFDRLSRSKSGRDQQLAIQVFSLSDSYPKVALSLADYYFETRSDNFQDGLVHLSCARTNGKLRRTSNALKDFHKALHWQNDNPNHDVGADLEYAYFVAIGLLTTEYENARQAISRRERVFFEQSSMLKLHVAQAVLFADTGDDDMAQNSADWAIRFFGSKGVPHGVHKKLIWRLSRIAGFSRLQAFQFSWKAKSQ